MKLLLRIIKMTGGYWKYLTISIFSLIMLNILNFTTPALVRELTSRLEQNTLTENFIWLLSGILLLAYLLRFLFSFLSSYLSHKVSWNLVPEIYWKMYDHLQKLSLHFYHNKQTGDLMSHIINDADKVETLISHALPDIFSSVFTILIIVILLFSINVKLAMATCIPIPFVIVFAVKFSSRISSIFVKSRKVMGEINAILQDNLSGIKEIQAFGKQREESKRVHEITRKYAALEVNALKNITFFRPMIQFFTSIGTVVVLGYGGWMGLHGELPISDIVGFILYLNLLYEPVTTMSRTLEDFTRAFSGAIRIFEILDSEPDIVDLPDAVPMEKCDGGLTFENVSFHYSFDSPVLKNVSFHVEPGKMLALVGPTGVGKTTIISLIERFYDPQEGRVLIDGQDIRKYKIDSLRKNISMVLQDVFLFHGTIEENIAYGAANPSIEQIIEAAKIASAHEFIQDMPEAYKTMIGERGVRLSGGQKQRIAIARAVLRNSPILILDEATASVDVQTEKEIQDSIQKLAGTRTIIVIAHRLSTVKRADQILVLDQGEIVEVGTHDELSKTGGLYASYCSVQFQAEEMD
ncbi:ABC transporter ATP-binding protein [Flexilinea flocculi]|uniref:ABC-type multidrug transport system, ATPase and permease component n=1 Tax=Flexilinea flocculi TaxID=1678840 RepID=A0A0S7BSI7_9CHLR|nr:ABC transporter ATP-binding protein [Flexilinea flocculi]GAP41451.1 ABC-type multidrug transport system, ATPase and permease component [Flexilinea flocculi]